MSDKSYFTVLLVQQESTIPCVTEWLHFLIGNSVAMSLDELKLRIYLTLVWVRQGETGVSSSVITLGPDEIVAQLRPYFHPLHHLLLILGEFVCARIAPVWPVIVPVSINGS